MLQRRKGRVLSRQHDTWRSSRAGKQQLTLQTNSANSKSLRLNSVARLRRSSRSSMPRARMNARRGPTHDARLCWK